MRLMAKQAAFPSLTTTTTFAIAGLDALEAGLLAKAFKGEL